MDKTVFNRADRFAQGWYWAIASNALKKESVQAVTLLGRELVLYRPASGEPVALDADCPHRGASLAKGKVQQNNIRCPLHHWQFNERGQCVAVPHQASSPNASVKSWPTAERYGLIWVWIGTSNPESPKTREALLEAYPLPHVPELAGIACDASLSTFFRRNCHPNVVLINAIDAHHFNSVHNLPLEIRFKTEALSQNALTFNNTTRGGEASRFVRFIRPLYPEAVTYRLCYWYGSTGTVTVGPDFLNFYLMFALRPGAGGTTEGWVVLLTPERSGPLGWLFNRAMLAVTNAVAAYFAKGDREVFDSIKFSFNTPLAADRSISQFVQHVEGQPALTWKTWSSVT
jgi:phenylpropionate dioxygenase-like ring-hydroxylating dioxygenase large terminal subunit